MTVQRILAILLVALAAVAIADISLAQEADQGEVEFSGQVVDEETGQPIEEYHLQWGYTDPQDPTRIIWTEAAFLGPRREGRFKETSPSWNSKSFGLRVVAEGYLPTKVTDQPVVPPAKVEKQIIRLRKAPEIHGRVLDHTGRAVSNARLFLSYQQKLDLLDDRLGFFSAATAETDATGHFTLRGDPHEATGLVVTASVLRVWSTNLPVDLSNVIIRLPEPASLLIRYDIKGAPLGGKFLLDLSRWEKSNAACSIASLQHQVVTNSSSVLLTNLPSGEFNIARLAPWQGGGFVCDRQNVKLASGKTNVVEFVRKNGQRIIGRVLGLKQSGIQSADVYVRPPEAAANPNTLGDMRLACLDTVACRDDGGFQTATIPPGTYKLIVYAYKPPEPSTVHSTGVPTPDFAGEMTVTIKEAGRPLHVEIKLKARSEFPPRSR